MTTHDLLLIERAQTIDCTQWYEVDELMKTAHTQEASERLRCIRSRKFHEEEAFAGML